MKSSEFITEVAQDWNERREAYQQLEKIYIGSEKLTGQPLLDAAKQAARLVKICGRSFGNRYTSSGLRAGSMFDFLINRSNEEAAESGTMSMPTSGASLRGFAQKVATYFGGRYYFKHSLVWSRSTGGKYKEPENFVIFKSVKERDRALAELAQKGKRIYVKDSVYSAPLEHVKLGSTLISPDGTQTPKLAFQSAAILKNNNIRTVHNITDQEAASLRDIADTKNANAIAGIKAFMAVFKSQEEMKQAIDNSKKITPQDKAKLDSIIALANAQGKK